MSTTSNKVIEHWISTLGPEVCSQILALCQEQKSYREVGEILGLDRKMVSSIARHLGYVRDYSESKKIAGRVMSADRRKTGYGRQNLFPEEIVDLYTSGTSLSTLQWDYGVNPRTVVPILHEFGHELRDKPITFKQILSDLNSAGHSNDDIANKYTGKRSEFHQWVMSVVGYEVTKRSTHKIIRHLGAKRRHQPRRGLLSELRPDIFAQLVNNADNAAIVGTLTTGSNRRLEWRCDECSGQWTATVFDRTRDDGRSTGCPNCAASLGEKELAEWVASLGYQMIRNDHRLIAPNELDIIITELGVSLEFNGEYWHSAEKLEKTGRTPLEYHSMKRDRCAMRNVVLGFVWETDWRTRRDEVKVELLSLFDGAAPGPLLSRLESDR